MQNETNKLFFIFNYFFNILINFNFLFIKKNASSVSTSWLRHWSRRSSTMIAQHNYKHFLELSYLKLKASIHGFDQIVLRAAATGKEQ